MPGFNGGSGSGLGIGGSCLARMAFSEFQPRDDSEGRLLWMRIGRAGEDLQALQRGRLN